MRTRAVVIAGLVAVLVLVGAGAVYAYDRSNAEEIGKDVTVSGVDVSGLTPEQAAAKLRSQVLEPLSRPVVVRAHGKRFTLTPERARVSVDIEGSVREALARSRDGGIFVRAWRGIRGEPVDAELELDVSYSKVSIDRLADRVAGKLRQGAGRRARRPGER